MFKLIPTSLSHDIFIMCVEINKSIVYRDDKEYMLLMKEERIKVIFPDFHEEINMLFDNFKHEQDEDKIKLLNNKFNEMFDKQNIILKLTGREQLLKIIDV